MIRRGRHDASQAFAEAWNRRSQPQSGQTSTDAESAEVNGLVRVAELVGASVDARPTPEFSADLRALIMLEAKSILSSPGTDQQKQSVPARRARKAAMKPRRRAVGVAAAAIATLSVVGTATTSSYAAPGNALYPVKRGIENVQLSLQPEGPDRGRYQLERAEQRLDEAAQLQSDGDTSLIKRSLEDFSDQASDGADELLGAYADTESPATMERIDAFVADSTEALDSLSGGLPSDGEQALNNAADQVQQLASRAAYLCRTCSSSELPNLAAAVDRIAETDLQTPDSISATQGPQKPDEGTDEGKKPSGGKQPPGSSGTSPGSAGSPGDVAKPKPPLVPGVEPTVPARPDPKPSTSNPSQPGGGLLGDGGLIDSLLGVLIPGK